MTSAKFFEGVYFKGRSGGVAGVCSRNVQLF